MTRAAAIGGSIRQFFHLPRPVYWLSAAAFFASLATMAMKFLALFLATDLGYPVEAIGRVLMAYGLGAIIGAFGGGTLTDRLGSRAVLIASLLPLAPLFVVFVGVPAALLPLVIFALGVLQAAFRPAYNGALMRLCSADERSRSYSAYITAVNIGGSLAGALGGILAAHDFRLILAASALPPLAAALCVWRALPGQLIVTPRAIAAGASAPDRFAILRDRRFLALCLIELFCAFIMAQIFSTYPIYLKDAHGFSPETFGYLLMVNGLLVALLSLPLTTLSGRYRDDLVTLLAIALFGGGFAVLPLSAAAWFALTTVIVWTLGEILLWPMLMKLAMRAAEHTSGGTYLGAYHSIFSISQIVSPLIGTWIYATQGGHVLWLICGGLSILAAVILWASDLGRAPATRFTSLEKAQK
jgi:predicted MFS family arabinose efflux permease